MKKKDKRALRQAGLHYVSDDDPGIQRRKVGRGFSYIDPDGTRIQDCQKRDRLKQLAIPPAWRDVWICPDPHGHLQATGRDTKGRKQYRYHPMWTTLRNRAKFETMSSFGRALPALREQIDAHLQLARLSRPKVLALVVALLERTLIRVGNTEYARANRSFGLTTLRDRHVEFAEGEVQFEFVGKSGIEHCIHLDDPRLIKTIRRCYDLPGYHLFQYVNANGDRQQVSSEDVNEYLKNITGDDFTAKDFRTWGGTVLTARSLGELGDRNSKKKAKKQIKKAIQHAAQRLGNRPATCRKYYVHPKVPKTYLAGDLVPLMRTAPKTVKFLEPHECAVLELLET